MRLAITHRTGFHYDAPVSASYNEARMTPVSTPHQRVWASTVAIDPVPWRMDYTDYWGTAVTCFELHESHQELEVIAESVVETQPAPAHWARHRTVGAGDPDWAELRAAVDPHHEFVTDSERTLPHPDLAALVAPMAEAPPRLAALAACELVTERLEYRSGVTGVASTAAEVWAGGQGVCQDFAHVATGALHELGIPARYVSGYVHPAGLEGRVGEVVVGESHAWVEFWCGEWVAFDPSAGHPPTGAYVKVGHGRDYPDVSPLRGTYAGGGSDMFVSVSISLIS